MAHFKEIIAGVKSCFSLTSNERLTIMLLLALFLIGLGLRWWHLSHEQADGYEHLKSETNASQK